MTILCHGLTYFAAAAHPQVCAVHSEFEQVLQSDSVRLLQARTRRNHHDGLKSAQDTQLLAAIKNRVCV